MAHSHPYILSCLTHGVVALVAGVCVMQGGGTGEGGVSETLKILGVAPPPRGGGGGAAARGRAGGGGGGRGAPPRGGGGPPGGGGRL